jgi:hypothetical protein
MLSPNMPERRRFLLAWTVHESAESFHVKDAKAQIP